MEANLLALSGFTFWAFWIIIAVATCVLIGLTENEHWGWATVIFTVFFIGLGVMGLFNLYTFTTNHPLEFFECFACYLGVACFWGAFKWWRYCVKHRNLYEAAKNDFLRARKATLMTSALRVEWTKKLQTSNHYDRHAVWYAEAPQASDHKQKIMTWMYLWPFSMLGTFLSDFLRKLWGNLYNWMSGIYDSISLAVWKGTENDLASEEDLAAAEELRQSR